MAVYDRKAAAFTVQHNVEQRFRSASLVKLLIAIDYLWTRETVAAGERKQLDLMLSRSDDNAASHFYNLGGRTAVIARMNQRLGMTVVPPTAPRTGWGSTEVSAAHLVRVYRYLLDEAPARVGQYILGRLRKGTFTKCGTDGYDQSFGIPSAFPGVPWAAKQGWYEFASAPKNCTSATPAVFVPAEAEVVPVEFVPVEVAPALAPVDFTGEALHTTGIVGPDDRSIVVILTVHPHGTQYSVATAAVTKLAASLPLTA
ncbi:lipoprotein [Virgisporangium aurantiacum]|uniref:Lipoprotein n=1 Tax=Virgisporangium aurantiacum TaxID=175570 RepID=A0A8J3ZD88_9ACTN|nr:lipoprotein [Virgisporangium aurantiacum]